VGHPGTHDVELLAGVRPTALSSQPHPILIPRLISLLGEVLVTEVLQMVQSIDIVLFEDGLLIDQLTQRCLMLQHQHQLRHQLIGCLLVI